MEKSKMDIIIVKKEIGGLVSAYQMNQKIFRLSDFIEKYPFMDINNKEYFEIKTVEVHRVLRGAWNLPQYLE